jgi:hypothetical protein
MLSKKSIGVLNDVAAHRTVAADDFADACKAANIPFYVRCERNVVLVGPPHNRQSLSLHQETIRGSSTLASLAQQALEIG